MPSPTAGLVFFNEAFRPDDHKRTLMDGTTHAAMKEFFESGDKEKNSRIKDFQKWIEGQRLLDIV